MITLFRWIRLQQLKIKWKFEIMRFIDKQVMKLIKSQEELEKKFVDSFAKLIHESNTKYAENK